MPALDFQQVTEAARAFPGIERSVKYDGSPVWKVRGVFFAGVATHPSAEPGTLVIRYEIEKREALLEEAPQNYYLTEYYAPYPLILVRLAEVTGEELRDLLATSYRLSMQKTRPKMRKNARFESNLTG